MDATTLDQVRAGLHATWSTGDYPQVGQRLAPVALEVVAASGCGPGDAVLDVGAGAGGVTIPAAMTGADVTGIDQTDAWFDVARAAADAAGVEVELWRADAEDLPFGDDAFDVVTSSFAHIFAPRHDVVAAEMARVLKPGGRLAVSAWITRGASVFGAFLPYLPSPPGGVDSPMAWGEPGYIEERFAAHGVDLQTEERNLRWSFPDVDGFFDFLFSASGPWVLSREVLREQGVLDEATAEAKRLAEASNVATDGTFALDMPYLLATGTKR